VGQLSRVPLQRKRASGGARDGLERENPIRKEAFDMTSDFAARQRATWEAIKANPWGAFISERPALFSPGAAAQDAANGKNVYMRFGPMYLAMEFTSNLAEAKAHHETAYIGDWSPLAKIIVKGPDALKFLSWLGMNDLSKFEIGQIKHHVQLDESGYVAMEGILLRLGDDEFMFTAGSGDWLLYQFGQGEWDATVTEVTPDRYIFGVQGPKSLEILEKLSDGGLRDIAFNRSRPATIAGMDVRILRTGISGELGYEIHGPAENGNAIWGAVVEAGKDLGLLQLGFKAMSNQHVEAGIATNGLDYLPASIPTPGAPWQFKSGGPTGSFIPTGLHDFFRKPGELGWTPRAGSREDDYLGRAAVEADKAAGDSGRTFVGLTWDTEDVIGVLTSLYLGDEVVDQFEFPRAAGAAFDFIQVNGENVGVASGRTYSPILRRTISFGVIDKAHAAVGTQVGVLWGSPSSPQRLIRATVTSLPFVPDNRRIDVTRQ
jgi:vanillate/3-O-methylgallate O-demethylase